LEQDWNVLYWHNIHTSVRRFKHVGGTQTVWWYHSVIFSFVGRKGG
jgi:hypothetical protein